MDEEQALEQVRARMSARFPEVPAETVQLVVRELHRRFDGPVRDFVPILVEREAKIRLAGLVEHARHAPAVS